jgi:replicative DNA helicase
MDNQIAPPQNLEAERSVLGGILRDNESIVQVQEILRAEDFYLESHRKMFQAMAELADRSAPIDLLILSDLLKAKGDIESIGGTASIAQLAEEIPTAVNIAHYARIVKRCSEQRSAISILQRGIEHARLSGADVSDVVATLTSQLLKLQGTTRQGFHISELLPRCLKEIENAFHSKGRIVGVPTGLSEFELSYGGLSRGDLAVIGGRASMGKTSFATTIAKNAAEQGFTVAFVSAESPPSKIVLRLLSQASGIENVRLHTGILRDSDFGKLIAAAGRLADLPMWFLGGTRSWELIKTWLRGVKLRDPKLALVVIDYAQLLSAPVEEKKRYLEVSKISAESKGLALELNAATLLLSQLSRDIEKQSDKRPRLSDLRESGSLEQDADLVFLLFREWSYDKSKDRNDAELNLAKNRDGRTGVINIRFDEETLTFSDYHPPASDQEHEEPHLFGGNGRDRRNDA